MVIYWNAVTANSFCTSFNSKIGNYIRLTIRKNTQDKYNLYLAVRVWKEDGAAESKLCQEQKVAGFGKVTIEEAKAAAEKWFRSFVKDQLYGANLGISDLL